MVTKAFVDETGIKSTEKVTKKPPAPPPPPRNIKVVRPTTVVDPTGNNTDHLVKNNNHGAQQNGNGNGNGMNTSREVEILSHSLQSNAALRSLYHDKKYHPSTNHREQQLHRQQTNQHNQPQNCNHFQVNSPLTQYNSNQGNGISAPAPATAHYSNYAQHNNNLAAAAAANIRVQHVPHNNKGHDGHVPNGSGTINVTSTSNTNGHGHGHTPAQINNGNPNHPSQSTPQKIIIKPCSTDVVQGKGFSAFHAVNEFYRSILKRYYKNFINADPVTKKNIVHAIYNEITRQKPQGGRFLRYEKSLEIWEELNTKESFEYILYVLNDCESRENEKRKRVRDSPEKLAARKERRLSEVTIIDIDGEEDQNENENAEEPQQKTQQHQQLGVATAGSISDNATPLDMSVEDRQAESASSETAEIRQCITCLGTGILPGPKTSSSGTIQAPSSQLPIPQHLMQKTATASAVTGEVETFNEAPNTNGKNEEIHDSSHMTAWEAHIRINEEQLGIPKNPNLTYPERILEIERQLKAKRDDEHKIPLNLLDDRNMEAILDQAEKKWGIEVPEGYNFAQRVELIEKTAFNYMARLQVWL